MKLRSMTAVGSAVVSSPKEAPQASHYEIVVRSVNGRFLDLRLHLPKDMISLERPFRELAGNYLARGTIDIFLQKRKSSALKLPELRELKPLKAQIKEARKLAAALKVPFDFTLKDALAQIAENESERLAQAPGGDESKLLLEAFEAALKANSQEREREGLALQNQILGLVQQLLQIGQEMEKNANKSREESLVRLKEKFDKYLRTPDLDRDRWMAELASSLDKLDITEETVRMREHLLAVKTQVNTRGAIGKKLEFYIQELVREINTIGSKSAHVDLTQCVVEAKTKVEQMREQVQNVE